MVAAGAVIEHKSSGKILLVKRSDKLDWHPGEWEIDYGRIDQFEHPEAGLKREVEEEVGICDLEIGPVIRVWHIYRGSKSVENDLVGITYACSTHTLEVKISSEHAAYKWVTPKEALKLVKIDGVRLDLERFLALGS